MKVLKSRIEKIIKNNVPKSFDSHMIISILREKYPNDYLYNSRNIATKDNLIALYHAHIAKIIKTFNDKLIKQMNSLSKSKNVCNNYSKCAQWTKL